jgi:hypothetical protein
MTGRKDRVSHSGPFQGLSHRHCEPTNSPLSEHGGADVAERPLARMASMPIDFGLSVNVNSETGSIFVHSQHTNFVHNATKIDVVIFV